MKQESKLLIILRNNRCIYSRILILLCAGVQGPWPGGNPCGNFRQGESLIFSYVYKLYLLYRHRTEIVFKSDDGIKVDSNYQEYTRYGTGTQSDLLTLKVHLPPSCWREIFTRRPALKISNFGNEPETLPL